MNSFFYTYEDHLFKSPEKEKKLCGYETCYWLCDVRELHLKTRIFQISRWRKDPLTNTPRAYGDEVFVKYVCIL